MNGALHPSRLITSFVVPSEDADGRSHPSGFSGAEQSPVTPALPHSTHQVARPYHLGLDFGGSSPLFNSPSFPPQRSLFPQFERWFGDTQSREYQQPHPNPQPQQHNAFGHRDSVDPSMESLQMPRLPLSSARMPSYWNEYDEPSMMGSSLYSLPIMSDPTHSVNLNPTPTFFSESEYTAFHE